MISTSNVIHNGRSCEYITLQTLTLAPTASSNRLFFVSMHTAIIPRHWLFNFLLCNISTRHTHTHTHRLVLLYSEMLFTFEVYYVCSAEAFTETYIIFNQSMFSLDMCTLIKIVNYRIKALLRIYQHFLNSFLTPTASRHHFGVGTVTMMNHLRSNTILPMKQMKIICP